MYTIIHSNKGRRQLMKHIEIIYMCISACASVHTNDFSYHVGETNVNSLVIASTITVNGTGGCMHKLVG